MKSVTAVECMREYNRAFHIERIFNQVKMIVSEINKRPYSPFYHAPNFRPVLCPSMISLHRRAYFYLPSGNNTCHDC
jgi:hypothetical protein